MRPAVILTIEDEAKTAEALRLYLEEAGFAVHVARDGRDGLEQARALRPDLVLLDLMLPRLDGHEVCRVLRRELTSAVVMLTARGEEEDRVRGLDLGADDYVTKPFSPRELVSRVHAVLRRTAPELVAGARVLRFDDLELDPESHGVRLDGRRVSLSPTEFRLLEAFLGSPRRVFTRAALIERVFGPDFEGVERTVDSHVKNLRRKIGDGPGRPCRIRTVHGIGYKLASRDEAP